MSFINYLINLGSDFAYGLATTSSTVKSHEETINKLYSAEPLSIEEFEELYDMRQYNMSSRQSDKKILKAWDEPGVYVLTNTTKDKSYVARATEFFERCSVILTATGTPRSSPTSLAGTSSRLSSICFQDPALTI